MSIEGVNSLFKFIKEYHKNEQLPVYEMDKSKLNPALREYQVDAVNWMLHREKSESLETIQIQGNDVEYPRGGILADEMGLGKTVEVLACILSNPCTEVLNNKIQIEKKPSLGKRKSDEKVSTSPEKKAKLSSNGHEVLIKKSGINSEKYASLRAWYNNEIFGQTIYPTHEQNTLQCFCTKTPESETVQCLECETEQHAICVGVNKNFENYICPRCWTKKDPIKSRATFIISPNSISNQWMTEIKRHISPDLKVFVYEGVKGRNYIQPIDLANNDIVITTYQVLSKELDYSPQEERPRRALRHAKRYHAPVTPLTCVSWWRLCLDEAQMVEGTTSKTALMARNIQAKYRWAVTGTPIQKSLQDLFGLIQFLRIDPFDNAQNWDVLVETEEDFHAFLGPVMWRNSKQDVFHMLQIPPQTSQNHMLHFSPIEGYFYQIMHNECFKAFSLKLSKFSDLDSPIKSLDRKQLNTTLLPLLKLRQACIHPQVITGKYVKFKHTMTMEELMKEMVTKAKIDVDTALRSMVSSLNGIAGIRQIEQDWGNAVTSYRRVLDLAKEYEHITKVDTLQMIHTLHNLANLLEQHGAGTFEHLRQQKTELEELYLKKSEQVLIATKNTVAKMKESVENICDGRTLGFSSWWEKVINWGEPDELLMRINTFLDDENMSNRTSFSDRLTNMPKVHKEVALWLADADLARIETIEALQNLSEIPKEDLKNLALECHLGKKNKKPGSFTCEICQTDRILKKYESCIFSVKKNHTDEYIDEPVETIETTDKNIEELQNVTIYTSKKEGNWKPTQQERILQVLANYSKYKKLPSEWVEDSIKHLELLEAVRKEFKWFRSEWRHLSNNVSAIDELGMAKLRLRLPLPEEIKESKKKKPEMSNIILAHEVPLHGLNLEVEIADAEAKLKRNSGILLYLQNLHKNGTNNTDKCPICHDDLHEKWSVLQCGHCLCFDCIPTLLKMAPNKEIECPVCRLKSVKADISFVVAKKDVKEVETDIDIKGSYSTKVTHVVFELLRLLKVDLDVKVLIFSTWDKVLDVIGEALIENSISHRKLGNSGKLKNSLSQFKTGNVTALLIPLSSGSKGLNITEATHVFLVEPILNPADELQAVGRVHRIGQTKPTFVHRFIICNTVEERMLSSVDSNTWADGNVSLNELYGLFHLGTESPQKPQDIITINDQTIQIGDEHQIITQSL